jgi:hypothetical protein
MMPFWLFCASFLFVFLKAFQQRNVAFDHYKWVLPCSFGMAVTEVYVVATIVQTGYSFGAVVGMGCGGGTGALLSMYLHKRYLGIKE